MAIKIAGVFLGATSNAGTKSLVANRLLSTNTTSERHITRHNGHTSSMDGAQVRVLKESDQVRFARLLQCRDRRRLEAQIGLEVLSDLANETLERQLADQKLGRFLELADLAKRYCAGTPAVSFLDTGRRCRSCLSCGLGCNMLFCFLLAFCFFLAEKTAGEKKRDKKRQEKDGTSKAEKSGATAKKADRRTKKRTLRGALPPVDFRAVCLVRAIFL